MWGFRVLQEVLDQREQQEPRAKLDRQDSRDKQDPRVRRVRLDWDPQESKDFPDQMVHPRKSLDPLGPQESRDQAVPQEV